MRNLTYEFVVPSQVFLTDDVAWAPISVSINDVPMKLHKPIAGTKLFTVDHTIGNEGVVVNYTIFRVSVELGDDQTDPEWSLPFHLCKECLSWIRTACRQYWLGVLMSASDSFARGSIICTKDFQTTYRNFGASKTRIPPQPLTVEMWTWIGGQVLVGRKPAIPDVMFCDALLSFRDDDYLQTIIQFGITCELELNALIDDLLTKESEKVQEMYKVSKFPFEWKLKNMPRILGVQPYQVHNERFFNLLIKLYLLRGSAVHRAECLIEDTDATNNHKKVPVNHSHASRFLFAVEDFLHWAKLQRRDAGISTSAPALSSISHLIGPVS
jgi:hypothetical protein